MSVSQILAGLLMGDDIEEVHFPITELHYVGWAKKQNKWTKMIDPKRCHHQLIPQLSQIVMCQQFQSSIEFVEQLKSTACVYSRVWN